MLSPVLDAVWLFSAGSYHCRLGQPGKSTGSLGKEIVHNCTCYTIQISISSASLSCIMVYIVINVCLRGLGEGSLCTLHLHACQVRVTAGDSGLCWVCHFV